MTKEGLIWIIGACIWFAAFLCIVVLLSACTGTQRAALDPPSVHLDDIPKLLETVESLPESETPRHQLTVRTKIVKNRSLESTLVKIDERFDEFYQCFDIGDNGETAREYTHYLVKHVFECPDHRGICAGYIKRDERILIISMDVFGKSEILPLMEHEWAHAYSIYPTSHKVEDPLLRARIKQCIRYM